MKRVPQWSRRAVVTTAGLATAGVLLVPPRAGRAQDGTPPSNATSPVAAWTHTDASGVPLTLPAPPQRIVAEVSVAAGLWDYGIRPVGTFGELVDGDGQPVPSAGTIAVDQVVDTWTGTWGQPDLQAIVALEPDVIIGPSYTPHEPGTMDGLDDAAAAALQEIAPFLVIDISGDLPGQFAQTEAMAGALGADLAAPAIAAMRDAYAAAEADFRAATAAKPDLSILFLSATPDQAYVAQMGYWNDIAYYASLGLLPFGPDGTEGWEEISWEEIGRYQSDVILVDSRNAAFGFGRDAFLGLPTVAALPAVRAGQVGTWYVEFVRSYAGFTPALRHMTEVIGCADPAVVSEAAGEPPASPAPSA